MQQLIADLQRAEERCVLLEAEVREEVAEEMAQVGGAQRSTAHSPASQARDVWVCVRQCVRACECTIILLCIHFEVQQMMILCV